MPLAPTTRLGLVKPDPNPTTGDFVDVTVINANSDKIDAAVGATVCTSGTRPASPYDGQVIRETDTRRMYIWNATQAAWDQVLIGGAGSFLSPPGGMTPAARFHLSSGTAAGNRALTFRGSADTVDRFWIDYDGTNQWAGAGLAADVNLYRNAADVLKTDDQFQCAGLSSAGNATVTGTATITGAVTWGSAVSVEAAVGTVGTITTTGSYTAVLTGAGLCGVAFVAPPSGKVMVSYASHMGHSAVGGDTYVSPRIAAGGTTGAGALVTAESDTWSIRNQCGTANTDSSGYGSHRLISGLTSGTTYNVTLYHKNQTAGTATFLNRSVQVVPVI
jgi:hypothetical protein